MCVYPSVCYYYCDGMCMCVWRGCVSNTVKESLHVILEFVKNFKLDFITSPFLTQVLTL